jgi:PAS domain-containing protein
MKKENTSQALILRQKAEARLKKQPSINFSLSETDAQKLNHELEVHQNELEIQIVELRHAEAERSRSCKLYQELYDYAPIGYFTLSKEGEISKLNLLGSKMLGKGPLKLIGSRFGFFVSDDTKPIFNLFLEKVFKNKAKELCEVTVLSNNDLPKYFLISGIAVENREECLMTIADITELHKTKAELEISNQELIYQNEEKQKRADELTIANVELAYQNDEKQKRADFPYFRTLVR